MRKLHLDKIIATVVLVLLVIWLLVSLTSTESKDDNSIESIIKLDEKDVLLYSTYEEDLSLLHRYNVGSHQNKLSDQVDNMRYEELQQQRVEKEEKRIAEEKKRIAREKKIAEEKRKKELARIAEEERKVEIAAKRKAEEAAEKKKLAKAEEAERLTDNQKKQAASKSNKSVKKKEQKAVPVKKSNSQQLNYEVTFYTAFCDTGCTGVTASGYNVSNTITYQGLRIVAAPPNIPLGTKLKITFSNGSVMNAIALDRGGAIQGRILDILVSSKEEARAMGRQQVKVEIIK